MLQSTQNDSGFIEGLPLNNHVSANAIVDEFNPPDISINKELIQPPNESIKTLPQKEIEVESSVINPETDVPLGLGFVADGALTTISDDNSPKKDNQKQLPKTRGFLNRSSASTSNNETNALPKLSKELEEELRSLAIRYKKDWKKIAKRFYTLTNKHYTPFELRQISKSIENSQQKKLKFTDEEDRELIAAYLKIGPDWLKIVEQFPGRCPLSLRCRYYVLKKQGKFKSNAIVSANILSETELNSNENFTNIKAKKPKTKAKKAKKVKKETKEISMSSSEPSPLASETTTSIVNPTTISPKSATLRQNSTKKSEQPLTPSLCKQPEPKIIKPVSLRVAGIRELPEKIEEAIRPKVPELDELKVPPSLNTTGKMFVPTFTQFPDLTLYKLMELKRSMMYPNMLEYLLLANSFGLPRLV
jgi:hypothetical protein